MNEEETAGEMLERLGTDGMKWAQEFCEQFAGFNIQPQAPEWHKYAVTEGVMVGWFANAIEAGRIAGQREGSLEMAKIVAPSKYVDGKGRPISAAGHYFAEILTGLICAGAVLVIVLLFLKLFGVL